MKTKSELFLKLKACVFGSCVFVSLKKFSFLMFFLFFSVSAFSQYRSPSFDEYINIYKDWAIYHMHKYKIPASITLAQAILESGDRKSTRLNSSH